MWITIVGAEVAAVDWAKQPELNGSRQANARAHRQVRVGGCTVYVR
jgi:hypothetical protein